MKIYKKNTLALAATLALVGALGEVANANVVGTDVQNFNPITSGLDFVTVQSSETLETGMINFGLFLNYTHNTLSVSKDFGTLRVGDEPGDDMLSADLNLGVGLTSNWDAGISLPHTLATNTSVRVNVPVIDKTGINEVRLNSKYRLWGNNSEGVAVIGSVGFNMIEHNPFSGEGAGPNYNLELAYDTTIDKTALGFNLGYRLRNPGAQIAGVPFQTFDDQWIGSIGVSHLLEKYDTKLIGELITSIPARKVDFDANRSQSVAEVILGAKYDLNRQMALHAGLGSEVVNSTASPAFRAYVGLNYTIGPVWNKNSAVETIGNPPKQIIVNDDILFDFDKSDIKPESEAVLDEVAQKMKTMENYKEIVIEGHTDSIGPEAYNLDLSRRRADSTNKALVKRGIPATKLKSEGYGETRPRADNGNYQGRAKNRRVEFQIDR